MVTILWVLSFWVTCIGHYTPNSRLRTRRNASRNSAITHWCGYHSDKKLSSHLVGTLTSHWRPLFLHLKKVKIIDLGLILNPLAHIKLAKSAKFESASSIHTQFISFLLPYLQCRWNQFITGFCKFILSCWLCGLLSMFSYVTGITTFPTLSLPCFVLWFWLFFITGNSWYTLFCNLTGCYFAIWANSTQHL